MDSLLIQSYSVNNGFQSVSKGITCNRHFRVDNTYLYLNPQSTLALLIFQVVMTFVDWDRLAVVETVETLSRSISFLDYHRSSLAIGLITPFSQQLVTGSTYCLVGLLKTQHTHLQKGNLIFKATFFVFYCSFWMEEMWVITCACYLVNIWSIPIINWPSQTWDVDSHKKPTLTLHHFSHDAPVKGSCCTATIDGLFQEVYLYLYMKYTHQDSKWQPPRKKKAVNAVISMWGTKKNTSYFPFILVV